jgi:chemotaxis protein methyltransferase CheR
LIYFNEKQIEVVMNEFDQCLTEHGWILTSPAEVGGISRKTFKAVNLCGSFFLRRTALVKPATIASATQSRHKPVSKSVSETAKIPLVTKKTKPHETVPPLPEIKEPAVKTDYTPKELLELAGKRDNKISSTLAAAIARLCADRGMQADAIYWSEVAINKDKFNPSYYHLHAQIMQESGDTTEACKALNQALFIDPEYIGAYFSLGMIYFSSGDHRNANRNFKNAEKLLAKLPENTEVPDCDGLTAGMVTKLINNILRNHVPGKDKA